MKNIASYALFGTKEHYWLNMRGIVRAHHNVYPGWELRVHHDENISQDFAKWLRAYAQAGLVTLVQPEPHRFSCRSMLWRIYPIWDREAGYVLCRDADCIPCVRERKLNDEFLACGAIAHGFNDNPAHGVPLLGGMCSFYAPEVRPLLGPSWTEFVDGTRIDLSHSSGGPDQFLLACAVWPQVVNRACEHRISGYHTDSRTIFSSTKFPSHVPKDVAPGVLEKSDAYTPFLGCCVNVNEAIEMYDTCGHRDVAERVAEAERTLTGK